MTLRSVRAGLVAAVALAAFYVLVIGWASGVGHLDRGRARRHHRRGTLRFTAGGPARGTARLTITGLDQPLEMTWQLTPRGIP